MRLLIASNNKHKVREIKEILSKYYTDIMSLKDAGIDIDVVEDGTTFMENALKKAHEVLQASNFDAVLADDSGLMVDALDGAQGVYSARFAGEGHDDDANNAKLIEVMKDVDDDKRTCRFVTVAVIARKGKKDITATGYVEGKLLREKRGENGFGYDPLFYYEPFGKTFAEMNEQEKNSVSHRKNALEGVRKALEEEEK